MCSIGEDDFGDEGGLHAMTADPPAPAAALPADSQQCRGCNAPGAVTVVKLPCKEPQCSDCFLGYVRHKFRANLGANKLIPRGGRVLVSYDGSANASALLDMIRFGTTMDRFKKLHIEPSVLFVDEHCLQADAADESRRTQRLHRVREQLQQFGLDAYYVSIARTATAGAPADIQSAAAGEAVITDEAETEFAATVRRFETLTARQEFVAAVRTNVLRHCAEQLNCRFVFVADTCPDLAVRLLANIALGRGTSVGDDVAFCDARGGDGTVRILRPMRDFSALEVEQYVRLAAVRWCGDAQGGAESGFRAYGTHNDEFGSIQNLTQAFVDGLQANFQSTISTVFRTGSKIAAVSTNRPTAAGKGKSAKQNQQQLEHSESVRKCKICASALDCERSETLMAIDFSRLCVLKDATATESVNGTAVDDVWRTDMCYGCRNVFRDVTDKSEVETAVNWLT